MVAPDGIARRTPAPRFCGVDDIVVDQRGRVNHLDYGREADGRFAVVAGNAGGEQEQDRAQPLAAAVLEISSNGGDDVHARDGFQADLALYALEVLLD